MKPTDKNPNIDRVANNLSGKNRKNTISNDKCVFCSNPDLNFKDEESKKEYTISGMCQTCQDKIFN